MLAHIISVICWEDTKPSGDLLGGFHSPLMRSHNEQLAEKLMLGKNTEVSSPNAKGSSIFIALNNSPPTTRTNFGRRRSLGDLLSGDEN